MARTPDAGAAGKRPKRARGAAPKRSGDATKAARDAAAPAAAAAPGTAARDTAARDAAARAAAPRKPSADLAAHEASATLLARPPGPTPRRPPRPSNGAWDADFRR